MSGLLYHPGWLEARQRATDFWNGKDIGRPFMQISTPRPEPVERIPELPRPADWVTDYSTKSLPYRVNLAQRGPAGRLYFGEAVPSASPGDLAPNCLALYLGCKGVEMPGTVWCTPFIDDPEAATFTYDPDNFYWRFSRDAFTQVAALGRGKMLQQFPDLIEGLDTLEGMRGANLLLQDLYDRPEWVQRCLRQITDRYFHYYDMLYDIIRDDVGGSIFWAWAPGRMAKFQCDFSAMISADMFGEFMVPVLREMTSRVSYCMYHWDGPGAIQHHDHLLSLPDLDMLQWTPGAGAVPETDRRWWPLYHKTFEAGKKAHIGVWGDDTKGRLLALKREFGQNVKKFSISTAVNTPAEAEGLLHLMEC